VGCRAFGGLMKVGDTVKFSNANTFFAVIVQEKKNDVALMFSDGDIQWFKKDKVEPING
jgi:hypothetical protein